MSMRTVKLTIGVPVYNEARFLDATLKSLVANYDEIERIIITDNYSDDDTPAICQAYADKYEKIEYIRHPQQLSIWDNWRSSLNLAQTDFFMWMPGHDLVAPNYVHELKQVLQADETLIGAVPLVYMFYDELSNRRIHFNPLFARLNGDNVWQRVTNVLDDWHCSVCLNQIFRVDAIKKVVFDQVASDQVMSFVLALQGKIGFSMKTAFYYRENVHKNTPESVEEKKKRYNSMQLEYQQLNTLGYLPRKFWNYCQAEFKEQVPEYLREYLERTCRLTRDADMQDKDFVLRHQRQAMIQYLQAKGKKIVIFSVGQDAEKLYSGLSKNLDIWAFADNGLVAQKKGFLNKEVLSPDQLMKLRGQIYIIVANNRFYEEICYQLHTMGFSYWQEYCYWGEIAAWRELCGGLRLNDCGAFPVYD